MDTDKHYTLMDGKIVSTSEVLMNGHYDELSPEDQRDMSRDIFGGLKKTPFEDALLKSTDPLLDGKIVRFGVDNEREWFCLVIECADGKTRLAWVNRDPEGNGPGHLDIQLHEEEVS